MFPLISSVALPTLTYRSPESDFVLDIENAVAISGTNFAPKYYVPIWDIRVCIFCLRIHYDFYNTSFTLVLHHYMNWYFRVLVSEWNVPSNFVLDSL